MNWSEIPYGLFLLKLHLKDEGRYMLSLQLKTDDQPWYNQKRVFSAIDWSLEKEKPWLWEWAKKNLPIWETHQDD